MISKNQLKWPKNLAQRLVFFNRPRGGYPMKQSFKCLRIAFQITNNSWRNIKQKFIGHDLLVHHSHVIINRRRIFSNLSLHYACLSLRRLILQDASGFYCKYRFTRRFFFCGCESVKIRQVKSSLFVISSQWRTSHLVNTNISGINFHCYNHCVLPSCLRARINLFSSARAKTERESPSFFSFRKNIRC